MIDQTKIAIVAVALVACSLAISDKVAALSGKDCPDDPAKCCRLLLNPKILTTESTFALALAEPPRDASFSPGGRPGLECRFDQVDADVWIDLPGAPGGSGAVQATPGTNLAFFARFEPGPNSTGDDVNVTIEVGNDSAIVWNDNTTRSITFVPSGGPRVETFSFTVANGAAKGASSAPFTITADGSAVSDKAPFEVLALPVPWLTAGACVVATFAAALAFRPK